MVSKQARFDELYRDYYRPVHAYCRRRTSAERANDATAETFLTAWRKIDNAPQDSGALPWLYGIARGVISNSRRSSFRIRRLGTKVASLRVLHDDSPGDVVATRHETGQILTALDHLSPADQEVLRLSMWEELSGAELAIALDISEEAARQRLSRAKRRLADSYNRFEINGWSRSVSLEGGVP